MIHINMKNKNDEIIFIIQAFEQPRILKIILDKSKEYKNVKVYGFTRKIHASALLKIKNIGIDFMHT